MAGCTHKAPSLTWPWIHKTLATDASYIVAYAEDGVYIGSIFNQSEVLNSILTRAWFIYDFWSLDFFGFLSLGFCSFGISDFNEFWYFGVQMCLMSDL